MVCEHTILLSEVADDALKRLGETSPERGRGSARARVSVTNSPRSTGAGPAGALSESRGSLLMRSRAGFSMTFFYRRSPAAGALEAFTADGVILSPRERGFAAEKRRSGVLQERVDLRARRHGGRCARASDGDAGHGAAEARRFDEIHALRESDGESAIEGVACSGCFCHGARVVCRDVGASGGIFDEGSLGAAGDDDVADS